MISGSIEVINPSRPNSERREKINVSFVFTLLYEASKRFMKALKVYIEYCPSNIVILTVVSPINCQCRPHIETSQLVSI